jgi:hypothetical protein
MVAGSWTLVAIGDTLASQEHDAGALTSPQIASTAHVSVVAIGYGFEQRMIAAALKAPRQAARAPRHVAAWIVWHSMRVSLVDNRRSG